MFIVTGVSTTKSTAVHNYQLESGFTWKLSEFVWSEELVLDCKTIFLTQLGITCLLIKACVQNWEKNRATSMPYYLVWKSIT